MSVDIKDLIFHTFDIGMFPSGYIVHPPTGTTVEWKTSKEHPSKFKAREAALEELEKLVNDKAQKDT